MAKLCYYAVFWHKNSHDSAQDNAACNVAKGQIKDVDELCSRVLTAWDVIDTAVRQWCMHLRACVKAKRGHFEHKLSQ